MQWYYSVDGQQQGPVSESVLETLAREGTVTPDTLVWREGLANWEAYSSVASGVASVATSTATVTAPGTTGAMASCAECGRTFPKDDMVAYENSHICAGCKPLFFQKVREGVTVGGAGFWRYKKQLVATLNPALPARCVKCNAPTDAAPIKRNLYWHHPLFYAAVPINIILYVIIAMFVRKRSTAMVSLCPVDRARRRNAILVAWLLFLGGIGILIAGAAYESGAIASLGGITFLGGIIYGIVKGRLVYATRIDKDHLWLGGCGKDFLAGFPEWTGA